MPAGAGWLDDLEAARSWHDSQEITPRQPIAYMRRIRYCEIFGADWWSIDVIGWRPIGVNAQLLDSDFHAAREQGSFIAYGAAGAAGSSNVLFVHKPLFGADPAEEEVTYRFFNPVPHHGLRIAPIWWSCPAPMATPVRARAIETS